MPKFHAMLPHLVAAVSLLLTSLALAGGTAQPPTGGENQTASEHAVAVSVQGVETAEGSLMVAAYATKQDWKDDKPTATASMPVDAVREAYELPLKLAAGSYVMTAYQDIDDDGRLDANFIGIPKEPAGFSNGYVPKGPPRFDRARVTVKADGQVFVVELR